MHEHLLLLSTILHMVAPRAILVIVIMVATFSIMVRHYAIEFLDLRRVPRSRARMYGNMVGSATATFGLPTAFQLAAISSGTV